MKIRKIEFHCRYSATMEDDEMGRWARVAFIGDPKKPFSTHQIAWISKGIINLKTEDLTVFIVKPDFPWHSQHSFHSLNSAKSAIRKNFNRFIKDSIEKNE